MTNYYLGGDVSKGYCDFIILNHNREVIESNFQLDDTPRGHHELIKKVQTFLENFPNANLYAGLEFTGGYETNFYNTLLKLVDQLNFKVACVNPLAVKRSIQADLQRNKDDSLSAQGIAEFLISHPRKIRYNVTQDDSPLALKKIWKFIGDITKNQTCYLNRLRDALYKANPFILAYCKAKVPNWVLDMLKKYPNAASLKHVSPKELSKIPYITKERAREIIKAARESIGADQHVASGSYIKALAKEILSIREIKKMQLKDLSNYCPSWKEEIDILTSIPGIGEYSAIGLLSVIGDINRFESCKKLSSYIGVHPVYVKSGDVEWTSRMSKQGNHSARSLLFIAAQAAVIHNDMMKGLYEMHLAKGKSKISAYGIIMHKILRIVYALLKSRKRFDPAIDEANRKHFVEKKKVTVKNYPKIRRYQEMDETAPISRRQTKKRNERKLEIMKNENADDSGTSNGKKEPQIGRAEFN